METKFKLSEGQQKKLLNAHKNKTSVTLRLNKSMIGCNGIPLPLTERQLKKIQDGKNHDIEISASKVKSGGFLPLLMAAIPALAATLGGITTAAKNIKDMTKKKGNGISLKGNGISLKRK